MDIHPDSGTRIQCREDVLENEGEIHAFIEDNEGISIGGIEVFLIGSELSTRTGVRADIVGLADTGHVVVIELKQSGTGREGSRTALVQALEYAADLRSWTYQDLAKMHEEFTDETANRLRNAHADYFDLSNPLREIEFTMATEPRLILLSEDFRASDIDAARYLRDTNNTDITCIQVTPFEIQGTRCYGLETRLESKTDPCTPSRRADEESLPWLTTQLEKSYYERFGEEFSIENPEQATERDGYYKGNRFVSASHYPDDLLYTFKAKVFSKSPKVEFGVSPRDHEKLLQIIEDNRDAIDDEFGFADTQWRRIRGDKTLHPIFSDVDIETISPEVSETISRLLWNDARFQSTWNSFLNMVEKWHRIFDNNLDY